MPSQIQTCKRFVRALLRLLIQVLYDSCDYYY